MPWTSRRHQLEQLTRTGKARSIRIHSLTPDGRGVRVAFEFLDPPGPHSLQFYRADASQQEVLSTLASGVKASFFEAPDGGRTRILVTFEGRLLFPAPG